MRKLSGKALLMPEADCQPIEEIVERCGELRQLVARRTQAESLSGVVLAPRGGLSCHGRDRAECGRDEQLGREGRRGEEGHAEDYGRDQGCLRGAAIRG